MFKEMDDIVSTFLEAADEFITIEKEKQDVSSN